MNKLQKSAGKDIALLLEYLPNLDKYPSIATLSYEELLAFFTESEHCYSLHLPGSTVSKVSYFYGDARTRAEEYTVDNGSILVFKSPPDAGIIFFHERNDETGYLFHKDWLERILFVNENNARWIVLQLTKKPVHGTVESMKYVVDPHRVELAKKYLAVFSTAELQQY